MYLYLHAITILAHVPVMICLNNHSVATDLPTIMTKMAYESTDAVQNTLVSTKTRELALFIRE